MTSRNKISTACCCFQDLRQPFMVYLIRVETIPIVLPLHNLPDGSSLSVLKAIYQVRRRTLPEVSIRPAIRSYRTTGSDDKYTCRFISDDFIAVSILMSLSEILMFSFTDLRFVYSLHD